MAPLARRTYRRNCWQLTSIGTRNTSITSAKANRKQNPLQRKLVLMRKVTGKPYEREVMRYLTNKLAHIEFDLDVKVPETDGRYDRQIDIWLPNTREIVECKHHEVEVGIGIVDALV